MPDLVALCKLDAFTRVIPQVMKKVADVPGEIRSVLPLVLIIIKSSASSALSSSIHH